MSQLIAWKTYRLLWISTCNCKVVQHPHLLWRLLDFALDQLNRGVATRTIHRQWPDGSIICKIKLDALRSDVVPVMLVVRRHLM